MAGTAIVALAAAEPGSGEQWRDVSTVADRDGDEWVLRGSKIVAMSAPIATHLLITGADVERALAVYRRNRLVPNGNRDPQLQDG